MQTDPTKFGLYTLVLFGITVMSACQYKNTDSKPSKPTWHSFTSVNSPLPNPQINALAISQHDVVWISTAEGLALYEESQWTIFTTTNSARHEQTVINCS